ncbi:cyclic nucleotide-binding domain-containing protein 1 isoform X7 [Crocuta crocuta]
MPLSSLPATILSHMIAVNNVPPPPLRSLPRLKMSKYIDYGQLNELCHKRELQSSQSSYNILSAHDMFIKQYPKIFLKKKTRLPNLFKQEEKREPTEDTEELQPPKPDDSHNIAIHVKKARGGLTSYEPKNLEEKLVELLSILKKLPTYRTLREHRTVWKMLKTIPDLTSQLTDEHLKTLSKSVISETWVKGSTVVGNDGFYIILKGSARLQTKVYKDLIDENESTSSFIPQSSQGFFFNEDFKNILPEMHPPSLKPVLRQWSTFGTLEVTAQTELETEEYSVITEEDCEILKIPAKDFARLKSEKIKLENKEKMKLIHNCPYYEEWPTLSICELVALIKWKKFPPGHELDPVTKQLMLYTAKPTFDHLKDICPVCKLPILCTLNHIPITVINQEDVKNVYLEREQKMEWKNFKDKTMKNSLYYNGIIPGFGKWDHCWTSIPRNLKDTLISY